MNPLTDLPLPPQLRDPVLVKGLLQVAAATALAAIVLGLSYVRDLDLERELGGSFARGFVQVLAMGALIGVLFSIPLAFSGVVLAAMIGYAAWESRKRGDGVPQAFRVSLTAIGLGASVVIVTMLAAGAIESNRNEIEALLAIGVPPRAAVSEHVTESVRASLIPVVDAMRTLGLVYIPGMMAGMILGGANPIYAAQYQFVIMGMIFAAGGLTSMTTSLLIGRYVFTEAAQLRGFEASQPTIRSLLRSLR